MNKTEKVAFREAVIVVMMGAVINFPLQTFLLWLTIDNWQWSNPLTISLFTQKSNNILVESILLSKIFLFTDFVHN